MTTLVSTYVIWTNVTGLGAICDVTSWDDWISIRRMEMPSLWTWVIRLESWRETTCTIPAVLRVVVK
jgi:hypothetical protein